jgi:pimeloyl-ACP methyl ester carboxylesterase
MSYFDFRGHKVWYEASGDGPPVVFLHNGGNDHRIWDFQVAHFSRTRRVFVLDHLGFGQSDSPEVDYTLPLYVDQVATFFEAMKLDRAALVGHCIGGAMSLEYTRQHPERIEKLVLFNVATEQTLCAGPLADVYRNFHDDPVAMRAFTNGLETNGMTREFTDAAVRNQFGATSDPGEEFLAYMHRLWNQKGQMRALYAGISRFDTFRAGDQFVKPVGFPPTLLFWGGENHILPPAGARGLVEAIRPERVEILEGCGHMAMRDRPEVVNRTIEEFLAANERE